MAPILHRRKHLFEKPCEFCRSKKRWVQHLRRSEIAVENERQRNRGFWIDIEDDDNYERSYKRRSNFEEDKNLDLFCGDIFSDRFWYKISEQEIDKTKKLPFWVDPENYQVDEDWYTKGPQEFNKVQRLLTPWAARRQYGKVFFSTATYYVSKEKALIPSRKLRVEGYYKINGNKIVQDFVKAPRSVLLEPPRKGIVSYPNKAFAAAGYETTYTYHLSGNGILKRRTFEGKLYQYLYASVKKIERDLEGDHSHDHTQLLVGGVLFEQLRNCHYDFDRFIRDFTRPTLTLPEKNQVREHTLRTYNRTYFQRKTTKIVRKLERVKFKHSILVRRIQRKWRTFDRRASRFYKAAQRIQKNWRLVRVVNLGDTYTVSGLIGTDTEVQVGNDN